MSSKNEDAPFIVEARRVLQASYAQQERRNLDSIDSTAGTKGGLLANYRPRHRNGELRRRCPLPSPPPLASSGILLQ